MQTQEQHAAQLKQKIQFLQTQVHELSNRSSFLTKEINAKQDEISSKKVEQEAQLKLYDKEHAVLVGNQNDKHNKLVDENKVYIDKLKKREKKLDLERDDLKKRNLILSEQIKDNIKKEKQLVLSQEKQLKKEKELKDAIKDYEKELSHNKLHTLITIKRQKDIIDLYNSSVNKEKNIASMEKNLHNEVEAREKKIKSKEAELKQREIVIEKRLKLANDKEVKAQAEIQTLLHAKNHLTKLTHG